MLEGPVAQLPDQALSVRHLYTVYKFKNAPKHVLKIREKNVCIENQPESRGKNVN